MKDRFLDVYKVQSLLGLGINFDCDARWIRREGDDCWVLSYEKPDWGDEVYPAVSVSDLMEAVPSSIEIDGTTHTFVLNKWVDCGEDEWYVGYKEEGTAQDECDFPVSHRGNSILEVLYDILYEVYNSEEILL